jgi:hypothetical protein
MDTHVMDFLTLEHLSLVVATILLLVTVFVIERVVKKAISRFCESSDIEEHVENLLVLLARLVLYAVGIILILSFWGLPTEWIVSMSALSGAAIGFASTQTIGNLLAGLYIIITRPFEVNDYIKIGDIEGEVTQITMNYVMIYAPTYTLIEVPNRVVLDSIIQRLMSDNMIDYSFTMSFAERIWVSAWVSGRDLFQKILEPTIEDFWKQHQDKLPRQPQLSLSTVSHMHRTVTIRLFIPEGHAKVLYDLQPQLQQLILNRLDEYRIKQEYAQ